MRPRACARVLVRKCRCENARPRLMLVCFQHPPPYCSQWAGACAVIIFRAVLSAPPLGIFAHSRIGKALPQNAAQTEGRRALGEHGACFLAVISGDLVGSPTGLNGEQAQPVG